MLRVRNLMTSEVVTVRPETPLKDVARLLVEHRVSGLPVVSDGRLLGIVSEADLLIKEQGVDEVPLRPLGRLVGESRSSQEQLAKVEATTAGEAMTAPAITITPDKPISEAAAVMGRSRVNRLPVVDGEELVGIISRADVVRAYVRSDAELTETVRNAIQYQALLDPAALEVDVHDGNVRIGGRVERRSTVAHIAEILERIPGVIGVTADVTWEYDDQPLPGA